MPKANILLDATMLDTYELCPARFNYRFNLNRVTPEKAKPLDRGTLVHLGLEDYYKALQKKESFEQAKKVLIHSVQVASVDSDLDADTVSRVIDVLIEHCNRWRDRDEALEILEIEKSFIYVLYEDDNVRILMMGKIDLIVNEIINGMRYENVVYDHKSYDRDFPLKRLNNQFCNYSVATESNYLFVNRVGFQTSIKPEIKHKRVLLTYDPMFLEQWKKNTVKIILDRYLESVASDNWTMNLTSCDKYNRLCEYYEVCDSSGEEAKSYKLHTNFNIGEKWDVSALLGKKKDSNDNQSGS
jgi:hypothetical protein